MNSTRKKYESILTPDEFLLTLIKNIVDEIDRRKQTPFRHFHQYILEFRDICDRILTAAEKGAIPVEEKKPISTEKIIPTKRRERRSKSPTTKEVKDISSHEEVKDITSTSAIRYAEGITPSRRRRKTMRRTRRKIRRRKLRRMKLRRRKMRGGR